MMPSAAIAGPDNSVMIPIGAMPRRPARPPSCRAGRSPVIHAHSTTPARPGTRARLMVGALVVALVLTATPIATRAAHAAPLPGAWCGPGESTADLPDTVTGAQIHVVYAYATDMPDRTDLWGTRIARDLAGVDGWWQREDPTRTPRFDLADFPCDTDF